jgi:F-type H+-transporting ATPase subunit c
LVRFELTLCTSVSVEENYSVFKFAKLSLLSVVTLMVIAAPLMAQPDADQPAQPEVTTAVVTTGQWALIDLTRYFGIGLTVIGAAYGISRLASSALESMARQPQDAGNIQTDMIIAAALIEGFTFFALLICWIGC